MKGSFEKRLFSIVAIAILLYNSIFALALAIIFFAVNLIHFFLAVVSLNTKKISYEKLRKKPELFFTVLVPTYNEPPNIVINTLRSLLIQDYQNFEVIILDNNTKDENIWKPVEEFCQDNKDKLKFYHIENLEGYKSGAINYAKKFINNKTDYLLILDADYALAPRALNEALNYTDNKNVALVQFPQAYYNAGESNIGLNLDFRHFFSVYMNMANSFNCVPSTGTVSFIKYSILNRVEGFDTESITEDAELGFRLNTLGYRSIYIDKGIGEGLMPYTIEDLKKQRYRWSFGNMQIVKRNIKKLTWGNNLSFKQKIGFITHLTAWCNFTTMSVLILFVLSILSLFEEPNIYKEFALKISSLTIIIYVLEKLILFMVGLKQEGYSTIQKLKGFINHIGLSYIQMFSWLECFIDDKFYFERTNKFLSDDSLKFTDNILFEVTTGVYLILLAIITKDFIASVGLILSGFMFLSILYTAYQCKQTKKLSLRTKENLRF
jgi:cellulose synthase/poly-beta-1,6-N-acetylglucosamine synthase-like glycosyltransferase